MVSSAAHRRRWAGMHFRPVRPLLLCLASLGLASCNPPSSMLDATGQVDLTAKNPRKVARPDGQAKVKNQAGRYEIIPGMSAADFADGGGGDPPAGVGQLDDGKFTVNVDQASLGESAKLILGETLGFNYTIDPRVQGTVTLVSNRSLTGRELLSAYEAALRLAGAALIQSEGNYKVVALQEVLDGEMGTPDLGKGVSPGYGVNAIPLRYVSPASVMELLDGFMARSGTVRATKVGNMILIRGPSAERRQLVDVVMSFDVDWMRNQTSGLARLENARAEDVAGKVEQVFADDGAAAGPNALKVIPVPSINSLIVIARTRAKVNTAMNWIRRLDQESVDSPNYYVYAVQNGNAVDLARILNATFGSGGGGAGTTGDVAPDNQSMDVSIANDTSGQEPPQPDPQGSAEQLGKTDLQTGSTDGSSSGSSASTGSGGGLGGGTGGAGGDGSSSIRITPNPTNNTIVISATPKDYRKILATLRQMDAPSTQVLINTMIAEVSLNNQLRYGVQAYFETNNFAFALAGAKPATNGPIISPQFPGMNFLWGGISNPKVVVDALSGITNVRIVSSPSILVLENETATIKVGDQIPIQSQTAVTDGGNFVNSYEYRDTGVILKVKPRVSANGVVTIELGQELSAVQRDSSGVGDNPKFTQRSVTSKVSVNDQQTVLLGGLISGIEERARNTVPGADRVPILGNLIGTTDNNGQRTELIVFITPKIIRNGEEVARESQDLRNKMRNLSFD
ncbi:type II secretion system protein GspD [Aestuariivirga litoralis]|uniref:Type II secretion system protein GspD n=2 Tax=Aestuariivirga litoralis TaxID=2650924 RepID=A0A2W2BS58_9HYPH|nr:type II secretion system protein GspD [Aestuariivirga litoralis]